MAFLKMLGLEAEVPRFEEFMDKTLSDPKFNKVLNISYFNKDFLTGVIPAPIPVFRKAKIQPVIHLDKQIINLPIIISSKKQWWKILQDYLLEIVAKSKYKALVDPIVNELINNGEKLNDILQPTETTTKLEIPYQFEKSVFPEYESIPLVSSVEPKPLVSSAESKPLVSSVEPKINFLRLPDQLLARYIKSDEQTFNELGSEFKKKLEAAAGFHSLDFETKNYFSELADKIFSKTSKSQLPMYIVDFYLANTLQFSPRYVYNQQDLAKMNENAVERFTELLGIPNDENVRDRIIDILDFSGLVVKVSEPFSSNQAVASHFRLNTRGEMDKGGPDFIYLLPSQGIFYLADTDVVEYGRWKSELRGPGHSKRLENLDDLWSETAKKIYSNRKIESSDLIKIIKDLEAAHKQRSLLSYFTLGQIKITMSTGFSQKTIPKRYLELVHNSNKIIIVPVHNRLAGVPQIIGEEEELNFEKTTLPENEQIGSVPQTRYMLGYMGGSLKPTEINLPLDNSYLFCFPAAVKNYIYDGPDKYDSNVATKTNNYLYPFFQQEVQLAIDSDWKVSELAASIEKKVVDNYLKYSQHSWAFNPEDNGGSLIVIHLPCLVPLDCWKSSVEYLLNEIRKLTGDKLQSIQTPELESVLSTCQIAWTTLPYDQRRNWCQRIARVYRMLVNFPYNPDTEPYFVVIQREIRYLSRMGIDNWLEHAEKVEQSLQNVERRINELTQNII